MLPQEDLAHGHDDRLSTCEEAIGLLKQKVKALELSSEEGQKIDKEQTAKLLLQDKVLKGCVTGIAIAFLVNFVGAQSPNRESIERLAIGLVTACAAGAFGSAFVKP